MTLPDIKTKRTRINSKSSLFYSKIVIITPLISGLQARPRLLEP